MSGPLYPPPQFDHPFAGQVQVHQLSETEMQRICHTFTACTIGRARGTCHVYINTRWQNSRIEQVYIRHEIAHCNGWRHG